MLQKSDGHTCPYCRCDIRGTESILVEPYLSVSEEEEDDLEDVQLVMKNLAYMKRVCFVGWGGVLFYCLCLRGFSLALIPLSHFLSLSLMQMSSEEYQFPSSRLVPPLPPKHSTSSHCPSPQAPLRPSVPDILAKYSHSNLRSVSALICTLYRIDSNSTTIERRSLTHVH